MPVGAGIRLIAVFLLLAGRMPAQPLLEDLHPDDPLYRQHQDLLSEYRRESAGNGDSSPVSIFAYEPRRGDTLFSLAARLMIPYSTIATLNRMESPALPEGYLLIPTQPGLFVSRRVRTGLEERILVRLTEEHAGRELFVPDESGPPEPFRFFPGADFTPAERAEFLQPRFADPLPEGVISSRYGYRRHPMGGLRVFHRGIDLAAPFGTPVVSAAPGVVTEIRRDSRFGLSVHVDHKNGYTTVYAHLQEAMVQLNDSVERGQRIGAVGSTGLSTGPHLHFEVIRDGRHRDPEEYIR